VSDDRAPQIVVLVADQYTGAAHLVPEDRVACHQPTLLALCGRQFAPAALCAPFGRPCRRCHEVSDTRRAAVTASSRSGGVLRRLARRAGLTDDQRARRAAHSPPGSLVTTADQGPALISRAKRSGAVQLAAGHRGVVAAPPTPHRHDGTVRQRPAGGGP